MKQIQNMDGCEHEDGKTIQYFFTYASFVDVVLISQIKDEYDCTHQFTYKGLRLPC